MSTVGWHTYLQSLVVVFHSVGPAVSKLIVLYFLLDHPVHSISRTSNLIGLTLYWALQDVAKGKGERPIRPCHLFDGHFSHVFLKHSDNILNFDLMHHFHMKMSLFELCTLFSKVTLFSLPGVFCGPQIWQNALAAGAPPGPQRESCTARVYRPSVAILDRDIFNFQSGWATPTPSCAT